jgi:hypothetical protein
MEMRRHCRRVAGQVIIVDMALMEDVQNAEEMSEDSIRNGPIRSLIALLPNSTSQFALGCSKLYSIRLGSRR